MTVEKAYPFICIYYVHVHVHGGLALAKTRPAHWVIVLHLGLEGCSQPRELWFVDILMCTYMYIYKSHWHIIHVLTEGNTTL